MKNTKGLIAEYLDIFNGYNLKSKVVGQKKPKNNG